MEVEDEVDGGGPEDEDVATAASVNASSDKTLNRAALLVDKSQN
jgi:hypothetical protein